MKNLFFKKYKLFIIFYILVIFYFIVITLINHKNQNTINQNTIEHFNESVMLKTKRRKNHSECKTKCEVKYDNPDDIKVCKQYCKCKKRCNGDKKCSKNCKQIKMNIYRNDSEKLKKIELKDKLKSYVKQEKKEIKKEKKKKEFENNKKSVIKEDNKISFVDNLIDKYFSENDKDKLIRTHNSVKEFKKDMKKVLRLNKMTK